MSSITLKNDVNVEDNIDMDPAPEEAVEDDHHTKIVNDDSDNDNDNDNDQLDIEYEMVCSLTHLTQRIDRLSSNITIGMIMFSVLYGVVNIGYLVLCGRVLNHLG